MNLLIYFLLLLKASLFSTGGFGNLPSVHDDLLRRGWATDRQFTESLAVGQVSPGPNGLWVVSLGYLVGGWRGALLAALAITLPPLLIIVVERLYARVKRHPMMEGFMRGLGLAVVGTFLIVLIRLLRAAPLDLRAACLLLGSAALAWSGRVPVLAIIAAAALIGAVTQVH